MVELFKESRKLLMQNWKLEKEYFEATNNINIKINDIREKMLKIKIDELGVNIGDKVIDAKGNKAFLVGVDFRQKPHTYLKKFDEVTLDDFEFRGIYKAILKDGTCGKKEGFIFDFNTLKKYEK